MDSAQKEMLKNIPERVSPSKGFFTKKRLVTVGWLTAILVAICVIRPRLSSKVQLANKGATV